MRKLMRIINISIYTHFLVFSGKPHFRQLVRFEYGKTAWKTACVQKYLKEPFE